MRNTTTPRPYPNLLRAVADGLDEVFSRGFYADKVVSHLLKRDKRWGARDRAFIAETLYDCVRYYRLLRNAAAGSRPADLLAAYWIWRYHEPLRTEGFDRLDPQAVRERLKEAQQDRVLRESIPDWLDELGAAELSNHWPQTLAALNEPADVFLRANTLKTTRAELLDELTAQGVQLTVDERAPNALRLLKRRNLWALDAFKQGLFEVQDIGSQRVVEQLDAGPGMLVVDACAGAGGKSLQLAAQMRNKGRLIAMDIHTRKLDELKRRARRAGVSNIETRAITNSKVIKRLHGRADRLLLDVPCSGLGVLRRNPDAKWKLKPGFLDEVRSWQADILGRYSAMLKPAGKMVYATCSILPSESEQQVANFLRSQPGEDFSLMQETRLHPTDDYDGFYYALLQRKV